MQIASPSYYIQKQNKSTWFADTFLITIILLEYYYWYTHLQKITLSGYFFLWTLKNCALYEFWSRGNFGSRNAVVKETLRAESHSCAVRALLHFAHMVWAWGKK